MKSLKGTNQNQNLTKLSKNQSITKVSETLAITPIVNDSREANKYIFIALKKCYDVLGYDYQENILAAISEDLVDAYKYDSIEDIQLALKKGRQGKYGKVYKLNMITFSEWMAKHLEEKAKEREKVLEKYKEDYQLPQIDYEAYKKRIKEEKEEKERIKAVRKRWAKEQAQEIIKNEQHRDTSES